jgi:hypothetical protein
LDRRSKAAFLPSVLGHLGIRGGSTAAPPASARNVAAKIGEQRNGSYANGQSNNNDNTDYTSRNGKVEVPNGKGTEQPISSNHIVRPPSSIMTNTSPALSVAVEAENHATEIIPVEYVAETGLPTDFGHYRLRAYRIEKDWTPSSENFRKFIQHTGTEPCVIYNSDLPPGSVASGQTHTQGVPVRIHDQCLTSEVFRSQR